MTGEQKPGGLEVVAWLTTGGDVTRSEAYSKEQSVNDTENYPVALTPAEPAEARIMELEARVAELLRESAAIAAGRTFQRDRATAAEAERRRGNRRRDSECLPVV